MSDGDVVFHPLLRGIPPQQGLKHGKSDGLGVVGFLLRGIPPQQGLKPVTARIDVLSHTLLRGIPPQQGLKQYLFRYTASETKPSQRYSTTTRIETTISVLSQKRLVTCFSEVFHHNKD